MLARVSEVESFRRWLLDDEMPLEVLVARLRGEEPASDRMVAGTAFHRALELAKVGEFDQLTADGFAFIFPGSAEIELPLIREVRSSKVYPQRDGTRFRITGQVDALEGLRIEDHKTTEQMDAEGYWLGWQWRFYLDIFGAQVFRWNVFEIRPAVDRSDAVAAAYRAGLSPYLAYGPHRLEQYRYPGLTDDCARLASDFYEFARQYLPERFTDTHRQLPLAA